MTLLVVNFHYVADAAPVAPRAIFPVTVGDLVAQVELLGRHFELVDRDAVLDGVVGSRTLPERACLITFDDGLRQQAELALPALLGLGVVPLFLVPGQTLVSQRALYVHKVHHVRETVDPHALLELLAEPLARSGHSLDDVPAERAAAAYAYDGPDEAGLKYLLNRVLPFDVREQVIDTVFAEIVDDERAFCERLYMPPELVAELERRHRAVGSHAFAHRPLAMLSHDDLVAELAESVAVLERVTGSRPAAISYPHGSIEAVDRHVADAAAGAGFRIGFTMERALNRTLSDPLLLARVDVNDAPGGSAPLVHVGDDGSFRTTGRMTASRARYGDELSTAGA